MRNQGDVIHVFYQAPDGKSFSSKSFGKVTGLRLHLSNNEQKLPSGGFALFVLEDIDGQVEVDGRYLTIIGIVIIKGIPKVQSGYFRMEIDGKSHECYIVFRKQHAHLKSIDRNAYRMEFEVRAMPLNSSILNLFLDAKILRKTKGDFELDDLKALLGGPFGACDVAIFDAEGGFKFE